MQMGRLALPVLLQLLLAAITGAVPLDDWFYPPEEAAERAAWCLPAPLVRTVTNASAAEFGTPATLVLLGGAVPGTNWTLEAAQPGSNVVPGAYVVVRCRQPRWSQLAWLRPAATALTTTTAAAAMKRRGVPPSASEGRPTTTPAPPPLWLLRAPVGDSALEAPGAYPRDAGYYEGLLAAKADVAAQAIMERTNGSFAYEDVLPALPPMRDWVRWASQDARRKKEEEEKKKKKRRK